MKFNKSNIKISGNIIITDSNNLYPDQDLIISLSGLNKSQSGVYCIRNKFNNKLYIGMARNLENRYNRHWRDLIAGKHCSKEMQEDYLNWCKAIISEAGNPLYSGKVANISPSEMFEFEVIIYCRPSELTFYENLLINNIHPEYNTKKIKLNVCSDDNL